MENQLVQASLCKPVFAFSHTPKEELTSHGNHRYGGATDKRDVREFGVHLDRCQQQSKPTFSFHRLQTENDFGKHETTFTKNFFRVHETLTGEPLLMRSMTFK